jgi:hypothetical protein
MTKLGARVCASDRDTYGDPLDSTDTVMHLDRLMLRCVTALQLNAPHSRSMV